MAKKQKSTVDILDIIQKEFGDVIRTGEELLELPEEKFSLSPSIDIALGGGIPVGCTVITAAKQKFGKTSLSLCAAKNFLEKFSDGKVFHIDIESRVRQRQLNGIEGLIKFGNRYHTTCPMDIDKETGKSILFTAERYLELVKLIIMNNPYSFIILDSISALCPETEMLKAPSGDLRPKAPKLISNFLKQTAGLVRHNNCILWSIHQLYQNTSGYGPPWIPDGGSKIMYLSDVFLMQSSPGQKIEYWPDEKDPQGQVCNWAIPWTALNAPGKTAVGYLKYGKGIDKEMEVLEIASSVGIVEKAASWYKYKDYKWQGKNTAYTALIEEPKIYKELLEKVEQLFSCGSKTSRDENIIGDFSPEVQELLQAATV